MFYATGKRKKSVAKIWLVPGSGKMVVNNRDLDDYFDIRVNRDALAAPLVLTQMNDELRGVLKNAGFLTRDSRQKERKKYGKKGARASFQFSKR